MTVRQFTDEDLGAYLDGELSETEQSALESQLTSDNELADRLSRVKNEWQILGCLGTGPLETESISDDFTKSTMAMAAVELERRSLLEKFGGQWKRIASGLLALTIGFGLILVPSIVQYRQRLRDLPAIVNLDLYEHANSVDFLRQLNQSGLFAREIDWDDTFSEPNGDEISVPLAPSARPDSGPAQARALARTGAPEGEIADRAGGDAFDPFVGIDEYPTRIEQMPSARKGDLQRNRDRYEKFSATKQEKLRTLHESLVAADDRDQLYAVLARYQSWLSTVEPVKKAQLKSVAPSERVEQIRELLGEQERVRFLQLSDESQLLPQDVDAVIRWLNQYIARHLDDFRDQIPDQFRRFFDEDTARSQRMIPMLVSQGRLMAVAPTSEEFDQLTQSVSKQMAIKLARVDRDARVDWIQDWLRNRAASARPPTPEIRHQDLTRFIRERLTSEERDRLSTLPGEQAKAELIEMYLKDHRPRHKPWRASQPGDPQERDDARRRRRGRPEPPKAPQNRNSDPH